VKGDPRLNLFTSEPNPPTIRRPARRATLTSGTVRNAFFVAAAAIVVGSTGLFIQSIENGDDSMAVAQPKAEVARTIVPAIAYRSIDDDPSSSAGEGRLSYAGTWQHVRGKFDGRSDGTSSRSFRIGSELSFRFRGERFEIFGIRGANGGYAGAIVDGSPAGTISFVAKQKTVGALVYASRPLAEGTHVVQIVVVAPPDGSAKRGFVNIDRVVLGSRLRG
jgi:hypothetical protein